MRLSRVEAHEQCWLEEPCCGPTACVGAAVQSRPLSHECILAKSRCSLRRELTTSQPGHEGSQLRSSHLL